MGNDEEDLPPAEQSSGEAHRYAIVVYQQFGSDGFIFPPLAQQLRKELAATIVTPKESTEIDLWLDSPGGDAHTAYKIGVLLRSYASRIRVVIPDYAKSAATLLTLVADEIYMAPAAELGPLDAQINFEQEGMTISANDRVQALNDLVEVALNVALGGGATVMTYTRLSRGEALSAMLDFSAKFLAPIVGKLDPIMLHWSKTLLEVAREYGRRLMESRSGELGASNLDVPSKLLNDYPTHGFVVDMAEAIKLGLPVHRLADYTYHEVAVNLHEQYLTEQNNYVRVFDIAAMLGGSGHGEEGADDDRAEQVADLADEHVSEDADQPGDRDEGEGPRIDRREP